jgi:hypothetical protein
MTSHPTLRMNTEVLEMYCHVYTITNLVYILNAVAYIINTL